MLVYLDDLLIATETIESVLVACNKNLLELRVDKCSFLLSNIRCSVCFQRRIRDIWVIKKEIGANANYGVEFAYSGYRNPLWC